MPEERREHPLAPCDPGPRNQAGACDRRPVAGIGSGCSTQHGEIRTDHYDFQAFKGHPTAVYTVDPDTGEETRVRNLEFIGTPLAVIQRILAFGEDYEVDNSYCVAESGSIPVSTIAPAMLVGDLELQRSTVRSYRPSILPFPPMR